MFSNALSLLGKPFLRTLGCAMMCVCVCVCVMRPCVCDASMCVCMCVLCVMCVCVCRKYLGLAWPLFGIFFILILFVYYFIVFC